MKVIDARGLSCPQPVLLCKQAIEAGEAAFSILVDDAAPLENVSRFARNRGFKLEIRQHGDHHEIQVRR